MVLCSIVADILLMVVYISGLAGSFLGEMTNNEGRRGAQKAVAGVAVKLGELQGNDRINKKRPDIRGA